ncbi:hypothetical protein [Spirosoma sp. KNUC1025]|uniref:hypothetical protein n=1 Tax=Spirosoma sp. KNUC1025 TaxID=2894082 RepID=UPI00386670FB|nr:hypothetical protein LN737_19605 [Spirosoma sp. KNUC1025]
MKTLIKSLLLVFSISLIPVSASLAESNPIGRPAAAASYKTGIYTTSEGKLNIALDKEATGIVDVRFKHTSGKVLFSQRLCKKEKTSRIRLDMNELPDGDYQVEITNGVETTVHAVTISTKQPSTPSRLVAVN